MGVGGQRHAPSGLPPGKTRYPLYRSPPPGFGARTVQPVASRYTDWAIQAPFLLKVRISNVFPLQVVFHVLYMKPAGRLDAYRNVLQLCTYNSKLEIFEAIDRDTVVFCTYLLTARTNILPQ